MIINDLFSKDISRPIEGVIKADDSAALLNELDEYVLTNEVSKFLEQLFDKYIPMRADNGVWISGFFGCGKSHLLKMLAYMLENKPICGKSPLDVFAGKADENSNEMLAGQFRQLAFKPSESILFNIDQKADQSAKEKGTAVLDAFLRMFNAHCGYYEEQTYIASFERALDKEGYYQTFKDRFLELTGNTWESSRPLAIVRSKDIDRVFQEVTGSQIPNVIRTYRTEETKSISYFGKLVKEYIDSKGPNFRLNFFVDEIGQFIANRSEMMVNLQTIAETLQTVCENRVWVFVTSQEDMDVMMGRYANQQANDFTKIQDRFKNRIKLSSQNVSEVIRKRLLRKNDLAVPCLQKVYEAQKNDFGTLFSFSENSRSYPKYHDEEDFVATYPFVPYQFDLFQSAIKELSNCRAFEGRHSSVGERSMLGVFQEVLKGMKSRQAEVGMLATFDCMFEGIRMSLKSGIQSSILQAQNYLGADSLEVRLLKVLFLVKFIKEFKATEQNLGVLLFPRFGTNLKEHLAKIRAALNKLVRQTYIEENGTEYSFLSDEEKAIESQIKEIGVDNRDALKELHDLIFKDVVNRPRFRREGTKRDYAYQTFMDNESFRGNAQLKVKIYTPQFFTDEFSSQLLPDSRSEHAVLVALPDDVAFYGDLNLYIQTETFTKQNIGTGSDSRRALLIQEKRERNRERRERLVTRIRAMLGEAKVFVRGDDITMQCGSKVPERFESAFNVLLERVYVNRLETEFTENDVANMFSQSLLDAVDPAMKTYKSYVIRVLDRAQCNAKNLTLDKLIDEMDQPPYGWTSVSTRAVTAFLVVNNEIELIQHDKVLDYATCRNVLGHQADMKKITVRKIETYTGRQVSELKKFCSKFFNASSPAKDAKTLADFAKEKFAEYAKRLKGFNTAGMACKPRLDAVIAELERCSIQDRPFFYTQNLARFIDNKLPIKPNMLISF